MKIITVLGARPQFVKAAVVTPALKEAGIDEVLVHTGQHYDWEMSAAFFQGLHLPEPAYNLRVGSGPHGAQTGRMLEAVEEVLCRERPNAVLVYGDTNSTLAGALAAAKLHLPVAHVEAGLRSFNRRMPEEVNRVLTDHLSVLLFAPTAAAVRNLEAEGIREGVVRTGDVMQDLVRSIEGLLGEAWAETAARHGLRAKAFALATIHRAENTDDPHCWDGITRGLAAVAAAGLEVVWLAHPRTRPLVQGLHLPGVRLLPPLPYLETQALVRNARVVLTDSGGLQKEAAFHGTPCVTLRLETEWTELVEAGVNRLAGADARVIADSALGAAWPPAGLPAELYGPGGSGGAIARALAGAGFGRPDHTDTSEEGKGPC
jgi:UDP-N-acetylglucosamine 2-epimerase